MKDLMTLSVPEIEHILTLIREVDMKGQIGYSADPVVGPLQAKLSIWLQAKRERAERETAAR